MFRTTYPSSSSFMSLKALPLSLSQKWISNPQIFNFQSPKSLYNPNLSFLQKNSRRNYQSLHSQQVGFQKKYSIDDSYLWFNRGPEDVYKHELVGKEVTTTWPGAVLVNDKKITTAKKIKHFFVPPKNEGAQLNPKLNTITENQYSMIKKALSSQLSGGHLFVFDGAVGSSPVNRKFLRVISQSAWQYHFFQNIYTSVYDLPKTTPDPEVLKLVFDSESDQPYKFYSPSDYSEGTFEPDITVFYSSYSELPKWLLPKDFEEENFIIVNFDEGVILASGICRPVEVKNAIASLTSYWYSLEGSLHLNCSSFLLKKASTPYIVFGMREYDKNILNDHSLLLLGDDYVGWNSQGLYTTESGAYRIISDVKPREDMIVVNAIKKGALIENLRLKQENKINWDGPGLKKNAFASFPITHLMNASQYGVSEHPRVIVILAYDSFGVLPLISRLNLEQALYYFVSGYIGNINNNKPKPEFFPCYSNGELSLHPMRYVSDLEKMLKKHQQYQIYLVNSGWIGGGPDRGERIEARLLRFALRSLWNMEDEPTYNLPYFNIQSFYKVNGVPEKYQRPDKYWTDNLSYEETLGKLANSFINHWDSEKNFFESAGPLFKDLSSFGPSKKL